MEFARKSQTREKGCNMMKTDSQRKKKKPAIKGGSVEGGVLLRLRVLKQWHNSKKKKSDRDGLYLGTVAMYRNVNRIVPAIKGRPAQMDVGKYYIKFDYGGVEHMHPDEVIACVNLYHDQVRPSLLMFVPWKTVVNLTSLFCSNR